MMSPMSPMVDVPIHQEDLAVQRTPLLWVNTYAVRITWLIADIEDKYHRPSDTLHNPPIYSSSSKDFCSFLWSSIHFLSSLSLPSLDDIDKVADQAKMEMRYSFMWESIHNPMLTLMFADISKLKDLTSSKELSSQDHYIVVPMIQRMKNQRTTCTDRKLTSPYTPQHNGVSERRNHTLLDMVRSIMNLKTLPLSFWDYALESAARILNMVSTKKRYEALVKRDTLGKLQKRFVKCIFVGYPKETMGYYIYFPPENKIVVARSPTTTAHQEASERVVELKEIQDGDTSPFENTSKHLVDAESFEPPQEDVAPVRRSVRTHRAPERLCLNVEVEEHSLGDLNESTNYKAGLLDLESNKWINAINAKMQSMKDNQVWRLVDLPPNGKTVVCKWLFKKKTDIYGNVDTYKARLVAKGYTQTYRINYEETFSPVADIRAIRILIAIVTYYDYEI
ncbi:retrotransposon protein, putative, ty1-copia subclass [Tanacetum coccineum]